MFTLICVFCWKKILDSKIGFSESVAPRTEAVCNRASFPDVVVVRNVSWPFAPPPVTFGAIVQPFVSVVDHVFARDEPQKSSMSSNLDVVAARSANDPDVNATTDR